MREREATMSPRGVWHGTVTVLPDALSLSSIEHTCSHALRVVRHGWCRHRGLVRVGHVPCRRVSNAVCDGDPCAQLFTSALAMVPLILVLPHQPLGISITRARDLLLHLLSVRAPIRGSAVWSSRRPCLRSAPALSATSPRREKRRRRTWTSRGDPCSVAAGVPSEGRPAVQATSLTEVATLTE